MVKSARFRLGGVFWIMYDCAVEYWVLVCPFLYLLSLYLLSCTNLPHSAEFPHIETSRAPNDSFSRRTANWAREQAAKMQLSDIVRSLTSAPSSIPAPWMGYSPTGVRGLVSSSFLF